MSTFPTYDEDYKIHTSSKRERQLRMDMDSSLLGDGGIKASHFHVTN